MSRRERSNPEWQALIAEHQILKRKLQSKSEALLILSQDLDKVQNERDQFKLMAEKLQERCQAWKRQQADFPLTNDKAKLVQMLHDIRNQKAACQRQNEILQQKLNEASGDVKLLREKCARQTIGDEGIGARHFPVHEREKLVSQLEESHQQCEHWRSEYQSQVEFTNEAVADRDASRAKADRLNEELSNVLSGNKNRIVDIDALCMENKYLQERVKQCQEEKNSLHAQINKYKNILSSRKTAGSDLLKPGFLKTSDIVISSKELKDLLAKGISQNSSNRVADLESVVTALLETINDKNLALHHLRNTNKILGNRVYDVERKLKTLEVAGLWSVQGANGSEHVKQHCEDPLPSCNANKHAVAENISTLGNHPSLSQNNTNTSDESDSTPGHEPTNCHGSVLRGSTVPHVSVPARDESYHSPSKEDRLVAEPPENDRYGEVAETVSFLENLVSSDDDDKAKQNVCSWFQKVAPDDTNQLISDLNQDHSSGADKTAPVQG